MQHRERTSLLWSQGAIEKECLPWEQNQCRILFPWQAVTLNYFYLAGNTYCGEETAVFPILLFFKEVPFL